jgi:hypothetical protein
VSDPTGIQKRGVPVNSEEKRAKKNEAMKKMITRDRAKLGACALCNPHYIGHAPSEVQEGSAVVVNCKLGGPKTIPQTHIADPKDCNRVKKLNAVLAQTSDK